MELDLTKTHTLLAAFESVPRVPSFLKDRYFPTNPQTDIFVTDDVLVDYKANGKKVAPFVLPSVGGKPITRTGFTTDRFTPPLVAPKCELTVDELKKRGFGESVFSGVAPADREALITLNDLHEMDGQTTRREEIMAAETLLNDACVMKQYAGAGQNDQEKIIKFHEGEQNPYVYAPDVSWDQATATILDDLNAMVQMLSTKGLPAEDLIVGADVASAIIHNEPLQKLMHNTRINLGEIKPEEMPAGASILGYLNVYGKMLRIISYVETYEDEEGEIKSYIPADAVILTAPGCGRGLYGAVTQLELDNNFHTYPGRRVPLFMPDFSKGTRTLTLSSCPVLIPKCKGAWISAVVIFDEEDKG